MRADHPRIRGEHGEFVDRKRLPAGSSPHTRGAPQLRRRPPRCPGIIPAYAGSTTRRRACRCSRWDHPRIRGEHRLDTPWPQAMQGSSPHTRGAPPRAPGGGRRRGIIPAYAGSTRLRAFADTRRRDHPRIRGEHVQPTTREGIGQGSSPHTRGARRGRCRARWRRGIIPAYAGSTRTPP